MKFRILIVSDHYPPFIGGAHRQTQLLSRKLMQRGHKVAVATVWQPGLPTIEDDNGVRVYRLKQLRALFRPFMTGTKQRHQPPFPDPITVWQLRRLIDQFKPDVIHSYGWFSYSISLALLGKQVPLLISARDYAYSCATRTLVQNGEQICSGPGLVKCMTCAARLYGVPKGTMAVAGVYMGRGLLRHKLTGMHSISTYVQEIVGRDFLASDRQSLTGGAIKPRIIKEIIPSFRENDSVESKTLEPKIQKYVEKLPQEPFILFVGALRLVKGLQQLLSAYEQLKSPPCLVLIGTKEADTPREFPKGVIVLESFPHKAVMAAWEQALFGVIPSLWPEPLGSVVYEDMSRGKAVIGTTPGGHTDMIVDRATGLLVPQGDVAALANAMQELLDNPALRDRLGMAAQERAHLFTADVVVPRFEQLYQQLVNESSSNLNRKNRPPFSLDQPAANYGLNQND